MIESIGRAQRRTKHTMRTNKGLLLTHTLSLTAQPVPCHCTCAIVSLLMLIVGSLLPPHSPPNPRLRTCLQISILLGFRISASLFHSILDESLDAYLPMMATSCHVLIRAPASRRRVCLNAGKSTLPGSMRLILSWRRRALELTTVATLQPKTVSCISPTPPQMHKPVTSKVSVLEQQLCTQSGGAYNAKRKVAHTELHVGPVPTLALYLEH